MNEKTVRKTLQILIADREFWANFTPHAVPSRKKSKSPVASVLEATKTAIEALKVEK
ncbi:hypothetical protein [uncultured Nostoc sp.]|uniref:hypothetical protein n=1 Tax=uncultured Nostoc sp. TaxID=340711 RepID=UPI002627F53A|nr:hypothetical protein [uncultured Nostoc sp.]